MVAQLRDESLYIQSQHQKLKTLTFWGTHNKPWPVFKFLEANNAMKWIGKRDEFVMALPTGCSTVCTVTEYYSLVQSPYSHGRIYCSPFKFQMAESTVIKLIPHVNSLETQFSGHSMTWLLCSYKYWGHVWPCLLFLNLNCNDAVKFHSKIHKILLLQHSFIKE